MKKTIQHYGPNETTEIALMSAEEVSVVFERDVTRVFIERDV